MKLTVTHTLACSLPSATRAVEHLLLTAQPTPQQLIEHWSIEIPGLAEAASFRDGFGNMAHLVSQTKPGETLRVTVAGRVETVDRSGVLGRLQYDPPIALFRRPTELTGPDQALIADIDISGGRIAVLHELMGRVHSQLSAPQQSQTAAGQEQSLGSSGPADHAHAFIGAARALELPARYVTGYLLDEDGAASLHAWAEAFDDGLGWIGFDPVHDVCPADQYIRLASGLDAMGTMPLRMVPMWTGMPLETVEIVAA